MNIEFPDNDLNGFNEHSKLKFIESVKEFGTDLITEANRLESERNNASAVPEITSSMVNDANILIRRGLIKPKRRKWYWFLKVGSPLLSLATGILYDSAKLVDKTYMFFFILVLVATVLAVTISAVKE